MRRTLTATLGVACALGGCASDRVPLSTAAAASPSTPAEPAPLPPLDTPPGPAADVVTTAGAPRDPAPPAAPAVEPAVRERSVEAGVRGWWAVHQAEDGSWRCRSFGERCRKNLCGGEGATDDHTVATTSLMLAAFLGAGHGPRHGKYQDLVKRGLRYLCAQQRSDGRIGFSDIAGEAAYNHALATWALCEACGLTGDVPALRGPADRALQHLLATQSPVGVWPLAGDPSWGDAALTVWNWIAVIGARAAGFEVPDAAFDAADRWFDWATDPETGLVGWRQRGDTGARPSTVLWMSDTRALTAAVAACRLLRGETPDTPRVRRVLDRLAADGPAWEPAAGRDFLYWFFGTRAMFRAGGNHWRTWNAGVTDALVRTQKRGGDEDGTWDPCDAFGPVGGRVYATAINVLTLEVYYRYGKVLGGTTAAPK